MRTKWRRVTRKRRATAALAPDADVDLAERSKFDRGAAEICGTTHKTVKRIVIAQQRGWPEALEVRRSRPRNFDCVADLVAERVEKTQGRISAKRLLPKARAAGYVGSARNFRRLVARAKRDWRRGHHRGRRPGVWTPGETLIIDWGVEDGLHVFCAVLAWSRFRFVRFAADEKASTTLRLLAECFELLGGVLATVLADRMGCLKAGVVANVVVPTRTMCGSPPRTASGRTSARRRIRNQRGLWSIWSTMRNGT